MVKTIQVSGFPSSVSAEQAKEFLENHVGKNKVVALKIRQFKSGASRAYVIVQFESERDAEGLLNYGSTIWYGRSYLKIREMEKDIIPKPRTYLQTIEPIELNFGCQVSRDKFMVLWRGRNVRLNVGFGLRKLYFYVIHHYREYKVELTYENIWQIQQCHQRGLSSKYLLIQLLGAPRIFKKLESSSEDIFGDPLQNYFKEAQDDQYVRTTDFTGSRCIGQSSGLCMEVPLSYSLSYFKENFPYYEEKKEPLILEHGISFCADGQFVPLVAPIRGVDLPFAIFFKVNMLVQNGCLAGPTLGTNFFQLLDPRKVDIACIELSLEKLLYLKECCYDPVSWLTQQYRKYSNSKKPPKDPSISLDGGLVYIRRVQVTPCKVYFCGPEVNVSNRVLRMVRGDIDDFVRVSFVDEDLEKLYSTDLSPRVLCGSEGRQTAIYHRILSTLENGIVIGNKHFEFLAFSSSQLRENSLWMFASRPGLSAAQIRERLGDFSQIKNVAKYAARLGQSLSSSTETFTVERHETEVIPDVEIGFGPNKYVFSDGIGKISSEFAQKVALKCVRDDYLPSAFQIRYGGYKGVVAIDPTSTMKLSLRKSMCKYESEETKLDVLSYSKYQPCFLNRQLISLLSTLGVKDYAFERKQKEAVDRLDAILTDPLIAREALDQMSPGENSNILKHMIGCGYKPDAEPYLSMMLQVFRSTKLLELRTKSRIFIPDGRSLMGCLDETRTLEYGQVFLQVSSSAVVNNYDLLWPDSVSYGGSERDTRVIKGRVVVAKNPCLHPGDVRVLWAMDVPALHHMVDCVVFPQKGKRPHPNECSGSDLDGDIYFASWDPDLIPPRLVEPMNYTPARAQVLDHEVTIEEVQEYFTNYIVNDSLGIIANAHTVFADREQGKAMSEPCIELARLFSIAVDFNKTGVPAVIPQHLYAKEYPDFMEKADKPTYVSPNVIGKLFREVKDRAPHSCSIRSFTRDVARRSYDLDMEYPGFEDHLDDAYYYKSQYDFKLGNLMDYYGIKSEAEILSGNIMKMSRSFNKRKDADSISVAVRALRKEARSWLNIRGGDWSGTVYDHDEFYAKASAWYHVTYHPSYWGSNDDGMKRGHLISFPWCVYEKLVYIKKQKASIRRRTDRAHQTSLEDQFSRTLSLF
ncbi:hypothetical protein V2J09_003505 [Rumex salicifolius]